MVLDEREVKDDGVFYTVSIRNRYGLTSAERIPNGTTHIVTSVPRHAIQFSNKLYTTDQHSQHAFRHEIHMPDKIFPEKWKNLN